MKAYSVFILFSLTILAFCPITDKGSNIYKTIELLVSQLPSMKIKVELNPSSKSPKIAPILKGFKKLIPSLEVLEFNAVPLSDLDKFLKKLGNQVNIPSKYQKTFNEKLGLIAYSDFNELVLSDFIFSVDQGGKCKYVLIFSQRNKDDTIDCLVGDVKSKFQLEPDVLVLQQTRKVFGKEKTKTVTKEVPKVLTQEMMEALTEFLQINVIEKFGSILKIIS